ncbi:MAG: response regulator transcription factor [Alphaproteobacteria bacterium]|nr:response regulator transcription factor [Alphaproteobacteria bacterium]
MDTSSPILVVDDEEDLLDLVDINLQREGFSTLRATTAREALDLLEVYTPALVVLDLMLPDLPGTEVCRRMRATARTAEVPVIILSAKGDEIDRVVGFEVGADDYVVKSNLSVRELVLRVRAVLRRKSGDAAADAAPESALEYEDLSLDEAAHRVWVRGAEVLLTATEFKLLLVLAKRVGRVQTRGALLQDVWGMPPDLNTRTVDTHVKRLREKLGDAARHVETVRGVGYRFNAHPVG